MDVIELWSGDTKAVADPMGAWVTNLSDERGDVLFPKRLLTDAAGAQKQRGGAHVCLPNFGPGGLSDQPQHGFGRVAQWSVARQTQSSVTLELPHGDAEYPDLSSQLTYTVEPAGLTMRLKVVNNGHEPYRIAPGFHPYFAAGAAREVTINNDTYAFADIAEAQFIHAQSQFDAQLGDQQLHLQSTGLSTWAVWTDQLGDYVCIEPTYGGNRFLDDPQDEEHLAPGENRSFDVAITW